MTVAVLDVLEFSALARRWEQETKNLSSIHAIKKNSAHRAIVALGPVAVPFIIERMKSSKAWWFTALSEITGSDPVPVEDRGDFHAMQRAWLGWYDENRVIT